jgi:hypothetical protein
VSKKTEISKEITGDEVYQIQKEVLKLASRLDDRILKFMCQHAGDALGFVITALDREAIKERDRQMDGGEGLINKPNSKA